MRIFRRLLKVSIISGAMYLVYTNLSITKTIYCPRMTPYAESVFCSITNIQRTLITLKSADSSSIVKEFSGDFYGRVTSDEIKNIVPAEKCAAEIIPRYAESCYYELYQLPSIEDYTGLLVMRFDNNGLLIEYKIMYGDVVR